MGSSTSDYIYGKARNIELVVTDCDGVLTDGGVYYSDHGEMLKRFSVLDGMGVERLRTLVGVETGIISGEESLSVKHRAEKLMIKECHLGIKKKLLTVRAISSRRLIPFDAIAYIGDDSNDLEVISLVGLSACPGDAMPEIKKQVDMVCVRQGGTGAFREFAEVIIASKTVI